MRGIWVQIKFKDGTYTQTQVSGIEEIEEKYGFENIELIVKLKTYEI